MLVTGATHKQERRCEGQGGTRRLGEEALAARERRARHCGGWGGGKRVAAVVEVSNFQKSMEGVPLWTSTAGGGSALPCVLGGVV